MWLGLCLIVLAACLDVSVADLTQAEVQIFTANGVTVSDHSDEGFYNFQHDGIPQHETGDFGDEANPNEISEQNHMFKVPKTVTMLDTPECLNMGTIAVAVNGIPIFNPYSGPGYNAVEGEFSEVFDDCHGHPQNSGVYHYHRLPGCIYNGENDQLLGVALDGIPIFGPLSGGVNITAADLDACNGQMRDGRYEYRMTFEFPYVLGCYKGDSTASSGEATYRRKRQSGPPPPNNGGQGGQGGQQGQGGASARCLYVKFCENPALENCPEAATVWGGNAQVGDSDGDANDGDDDNDGDDNNDGTENGGDDTANIAPTASITTSMTLFLVFWGIVAKLMTN